MNKTLCIVIALAIAGCAEAAHPSCVAIDDDSVVVDFGNAEAILKYDGSIPLEAEHYYVCSKTHTLHVYGGARVSKDSPKVVRGIAVQTEDGACRFAHIDEVRRFEGESCL